jgi:hypothetical protein
MLHPAMQYLSPQLMAPSYIFQYAPSPLNSQAVAAAAAAGLNQPLLSNPFLQSAGLVTQMAADLSPMTNPVVSSAGSAVNIAFIPGLQTQLNNLNGAGIPTSTFLHNHLGQSSFLVNSHGQISAHNLSAVPNLVSAAVVSAGLPTAAANTNIDQQCKITTETQTTNSVRKTSKAAANRSKSSLLSTVSISPINVPKSAVKIVSSNKSPSKKSVDSDHLLVNGSNRKPSVEVGTVNEPKSKMSNENISIKSNAKSVSPALSTCSSNYPNQTGSTSIGKSKSFAVGIRKNRNLKKSKTLSISGCPIEVGSGGQASTTLTNTTLLTTQTPRGSMGLAAKSFLPGLAPEPESVNPLATVKANIAAANWSATKHSNGSDKSHTKLPVTTIYLSEQSKHISASTVSPKNGLKSQTNGTSSVGSSLNTSNKTNSSGLTITPLSVTSSKETTISNKSSGAKAAKKANVSLEKTSSPVDVLIVSKSNDSSKCNGLLTKTSSVLGQQQTSITALGSIKDKASVASSTSITKKQSKNASSKPTNRTASSSSSSSSSSSAHHLMSTGLSSAAQVASSSFASLSKGASLSSSSTVSITTPFTSSTFASKSVAHNPIPAAHGWTWEGKPSKKSVVINVSFASSYRSLPSFHHKSVTLVH